MKPFRRLSLAFLGLILLGGCSTMQTTWQSLNNVMVPLEELYRQKALSYEKQGELQQALLAWKVVAQLDPENPSTPEIIKTLERGIANAAAVHFKRGVEHYTAGEFAKARKEFLITIRLSPTHDSARHYLKTLLHSPQQAQYRVRRGDSFSRIALKVYNDPSKAYIIAYFNDLDPKKPLYIDTILLLPELSPEQLVPRKDITAMLARAEKALDQKRYAKVIDITGKILTEIPDQPKARYLRDDAYFQRGMALFNQKKYLAAIEQLKQISDVYRGRDRAIRKARSHIQKQDLEEKLQIAQELMDAQAYDSVINVTEEILTQAPDNKKAKELSNIAHYTLGKQLLEQGLETSAIKMLSAVDKDYKDTGQLLAQARGRLHARAEKFYRNGVMHFLNEDLEKAIDAWQEALQLNPNHPKARQDMDNAMRLLDKWRGIEKEKQ